MKICFFYYLFNYKCLAPLSNCKQFAREPARRPRVNRRRLVMTEVHAGNPERSQIPLEGFVAILSRLNCIVKLVMTVRRSMCSQKKRKKNRTPDTQSPTPPQKAIWYVEAVNTAL